MMKGNSGSGAAAAGAGKRNCANGQRAKAGGAAGIRFNVSRLNMVVPCLIGPVTLGAISAPR